jgi:hypothetical protein
MNQLIESLWGDTYRKALTSICATIAAIAGAVVAIPPAWSALGLPEIASRMFVHEQVDPLKIAQNQTGQAVNQLILTQLQSSLYAAQQDMAKAPSQTVQSRIQDLQQQIQQVQTKISAGN